jgi:hypothetical protein
LGEGFEMKRVIYLMVALVVMVFGSNISFAASGLDKADKIGPKIKGFQLGETYSSFQLIDFQTTNGGPRFDLEIEGTVDGISSKLKLESYKDGWYIVGNL